MNIIIWLLFLTYRYIRTIIQRYIWYRYIYLYIYLWNNKQTSLCKSKAGVQVFVSKDAFSLSTGDEPSIITKWLSNKGKKHQQLHNYILFPCLTKGANRRGISCYVTGSGKSHILLSSEAIRRPSHPARRAPSALWNTMLRMCDAIVPARPVWEDCVRVYATSRCQNMSVLTISYFWFPALHHDSKNGGVKQKLANFTHFWA